MTHYDLFVIGAGSGGLAASKRAASYGARVGIAEGDLVGGTCVIRGCVPKKLLVYAAEFGKYLKDAPAYGYAPSERISHDWVMLRDSVKNEVMRLNALHISLLEKNKVELHKGFAKFVDNNKLLVGSQEITADKILIAVGGYPTRPAIPGIEHSVTSNEMFSLDELPRRLAIVGGGYIGVEFASIMQGLGVEVVQIIRGEQILRGFDGEVVQMVQAAMVASGIKILPNTEISKIENRAGEYLLTLNSDDHQKLSVDKVLYATGRKPNLAGLELDKAGIKVDKDSIVVDDDLTTTAPNIFALGDCINRVTLTPVAIEEGRVFADTHFGAKPRKVDYTNIATAVFATPQIGTVGLTEEEAKDVYGADNIKIYRAKFRPMIYVLPGRDERILMKLIVIKGEGAAQEKILGAHMVGKDAAEIMQSLAVAIKMGASKQDFDNTMALHPSSAEEWVTMT